MYWYCMPPTYIDNNLAIESEGLDTDADRKATESDSTGYY